MIHFNFGVINDSFLLVNHTANVVEPNILMNNGVMHLIDHGKANSNPIYVYIKLIPCCYLVLSGNLQQQQNQTQGGGGGAQESGAQQSGASEQQPQQTATGGQSQQT